MNLKDLKRVFRVFLLEPPAEAKEGIILTKFVYLHGLTSTLSCNIFEIQFLGKTGIV